MDNTTLSVFFIALSAMVKVALISGVGIWVSLYPVSEPLLSPYILKKLSALTTVIFVPALVVQSLGSSVSLELLQRFGILILLCLLIILISYANTYALKCFHEDDPKLFLAVLVAAGSPNAISMPLLIMKTICEDKTVNADYDDDSVICFNEASSMLFIYQIGWHIVYWSCGYPLLKSLDNVDKKNNEEKEEEEEREVVDVNGSKKQEQQEESYLGESSTVITATHFDNGENTENKGTENKWKKEIVNNFILSPCMIAIYVGIGIGLIPYLQEWLFYELTIIRPLGSAMATLGEPVVCVNTLIMSASLAQVYIRIRKQKGNDKSDAEEKSKNNDYMASINTDIDDDADLTDKNLGKIDMQYMGTTSSSRINNDIDNDNMQYLKARKFGDSEVSDSCGCFHVSTSIEVKKENKGSFDIVDMKSDDTKGIEISDHSDTNEKIIIPQMKSTCVMLLGRLIIPSVIMLAVMELFVELKFVPKEEKMMRLLIVIEAAAPSAQMIIVSLNQVGGVQIASQISYMYVFQYTLSIFTITLFTTLGMRMIYA